MKKTLISIIIVMIITNIITAQMTINSAGLVGLRTTPITGNSLTVNIDQKVYFYSPSRNNGIIINNSGDNYGGSICPYSNHTGNIGTSLNAFNSIYSYTGSITLSDKRQKENIRNITNALNIVSKLQGVKYDFKKEFSYNDNLIKNSKIKEKLEKERKNKVGFIAQDVYKVLPEVVVYDDSTDVYGIVYDRVVPILVEAIKEQQAQIDSLKKLITKPKSSLKSQIITSENEISDISTTDISSVASLDQNTPNPFNQSTQIEFYIPETLNNAELYIYDMNGTQLKSIPIYTKGKGNITVNGSELNAGMYLYTLIVDGKEVDTKRMILTK
jgi:hypothetical protein